MILLDIFTFFGRMHPLIVHLPIGFVLLAIIFDAASYHSRFSYLRQAVPFSLLLGFASALVACLFGFMLSVTGDYDEDVLASHMFSGILLAFMAGLLYAISDAPFKKILSVSRPMFSALCVATLLLLIYAGHQGASLTHGQNYISLATLLKEERQKPASVEEAMIFEDVVHPILEKRCMQCHNAGKKKGRLSLESPATMTKGGKSGPSVVPGNLLESELYRRITLDPTHEDFMPADGKTPLTQPEREMVRWWIEKGMAVEAKKISELKDGEEIKPLVASLLSLESSDGAEMEHLTAGHINKAIPDEFDMALVDDLRKKGWVVRVMLRKPVMLDVTLPRRSGMKAEEISDDLKPVAGHIIWLNLADNALTENDLPVLQYMSNLEKLRLERNPLSDGVVTHLENLKYLEAVNLNETQLTPAGLSKLKQNSAIRRVYTWKTMCDSISGGQL